MRRFVVGVTGASGSIYAFRLMEVLAALRDVETHLVVTRDAILCIGCETDRAVEELTSLATRVYDAEDLAAPIASGSFKTDGMVVIPCSMKTASAIANGYADNLLTRAADVTLKERRRLVVLPRETPLHAGHLRNLLALAELGATVLPPMPAFYHRPNTLDEVIDQTIGKVLDQFDLEHSLFRRWGD